MTRIKQIKALSDNGAEAEWSLIHELAGLVEELASALELTEAGVKSFYTATTTNAKSRDENRELKGLTLYTIREALAKYKAFNNEVV